MRITRKQVDEGVKRIEESIQTVEIPPLAHIPKHVAIIMDGNGRWAKKQNKMRIQGHQAGIESVAKVNNIARRVGVEVMSFFTFSRENWRRPKEEVQELMQLFLRGLKNEEKRLRRENLSLRMIGDRCHFSKTLQQQIQKAEDQSKYNTGMKMVVAIDYSGQWDIVQASKKITEKVMAGEIRLDQVNEEVFEKHLSLADLPPPDLLIRTSGEFRISNFFLWQIAYSELYFTDILWPDFDEKAFLDALVDYSGRERRFGATSEQIEQK